MARVTLSHDGCSYQEKLSRSIGPGMYMLGTPANDADECGRDIPNDPSVRWQSFGSGFCTPGRVVDTGSELRGLNYKNTKCAAAEYNPETFVPKADAMCNPKRTQDVRKCTAPQESSRLSNPPCTLRSTGWNRWEWLCDDPQERATIPFNHQVSNRILVKDNFVPCLPTPKDQTNALNTLNDEATQTLGGWAPAVPCDDGAIPATADPEYIYRSCQWMKAVGN